MTLPPAQSSSYERCLAELRTRSQEHLLRWWAELTQPQRRTLLAEIEAIPWDLLDQVISTHIQNRPPNDTPTGLEPAPVYPCQPDCSRTALYHDATRLGCDLIRSGKVAAFTVAGGQGTRLGVDGPKGTVVVTPVGERTLFEIFALTILAVRRRYEVAIPWYIMTSPVNHNQTVEFFERHDFFGLPKEDVSLFAQGMLPAFDFQGRVLLAGKGHLALAPDGHGGCFKALETSGALKGMKARGIEIISYFQVDNPLVKPLDPLFIGLHTLARAKMSAKVTPKADDLERVGNLCLHNGKITLIEYSDFPPEGAHARNEDGSRKFNAANLAIHLLNVSFVEEVVGGSLKLPLRRAEKAVAYLDNDGSVRKPASPNAVKLETFVFDVLPLARNTILLEVDRTEEFSPIKNATGADSLETAKRDQIARACRWLQSAGIHIPRKPNGQPDVTIAISPLFALDIEDLLSKSRPIPALKSGDLRYIE